jgi:hypothetical protein
MKKPVSQPACKQTSLQQLRRTLDTFYREYDFGQRILHDPIEFPHRYKSIGDIEIAGFLACCFAYGRIGLFKPVVEKFSAPFQHHQTGKTFSGDTVQI